MHNWSDIYSLRKLLLNALLSPWDVFFDRRRKTVKVNTSTHKRK